jgi:hypothetical protein
VTNVWKRSNEPAEETVPERFHLLQPTGDSRNRPSIGKRIAKLCQTVVEPRALEVIRDETAFGVTPMLWQSIIRQLDRADWLVLIASPAAAESKWPKRELRYWLSGELSDDEMLAAFDEPIKDLLPARRDSLLIVLVDGEIVWHDPDPTAQRDGFQ